MPNTYEGSPCRKCENTLRYAKGRICVSCKKKHNARRYTDKKATKLLMQKWS